MIAAVQLLITQSHRFPSCISAKAEVIMGDSAGRVKQAHVPVHPFRSTACKAAPPDIDAGFTTSKRQDLPAWQYRPIKHKYPWALSRREK